MGKTAVREDVAPADLADVMDEEEKEAALRETTETEPDDDDAKDAA